MRKSGMSYQNIADRLGYSTRSAAFKAVATALRTVKQEAAAPLVVLECERLDALYKLAWDVAHDESQQVGIRMAALDRALRYMERRAKLLGLDQPSRTTVDQVSKVIVEYVDGASAETDAAASEDS